jgi:hypothetical protein
LLIQFSSIIDNLVQSAAGQLLRQPLMLPTQLVLKAYLVYDQCRAGGLQLSRNIASRHNQARRDPHTASARVASDWRSQQRRHLRMGKRKIIRQVFQL